MLTDFNDINVKKLTSLKLIVRTNSLNLNPVSGMCYKNVSTTAPRLTMWSTWNSTAWLNDHRGSWS